MVAPGPRLGSLLGAVHPDNEEVGAGMPYFIYPGFNTCRIVAQVSVIQ